MENNEYSKISTITMRIDIENIDEVIEKVRLLDELLEKIDRKLNKWPDFDGVKDSMAKGIQNALDSMGSDSSEGYFTRLPEPQQISGTARGPIC